MLERATQIEQVAAIELNLACPNIPGKPTVAYVRQTPTSTTTTHHPSLVLMTNTTPAPPSMPSPTADPRLQDFEQMEVILNAVQQSGAFEKKVIGIKLAPYFDVPHFKQAAELLNRYPVGFVVSVNTIGNSLIIDTEAEQPLIAPKGPLSQANTAPSHPLRRSHP